MSSGQQVETAEPAAPVTEAAQELAVDDQNDNSSRLRGFRLYAVTVGVCFGAMMMSLDVSIIATAIPSMTSDFRNTSQIAWYPAAYTFATCVLTPLAGKMASVFPMNREYLAFSVVFLVGSIVCGFAPTSNAFIAGRAVAGIGAAGVSSNGLSILVTVAPVRKKPLFMGFGAGCFGIGLILGPVLGGVFTERLTWRWCFWINLPFISITIAVISLFFKSPQTQSPSQSFIARIRTLDIIGCALFIPATFMLLLALQRGGGPDSWSSATIIGLFVGAGVMMLLFVTWEYRKGDSAMIPASIVGRRTVVFTVLFASCHLGSLTIGSYYLPEWFQAIQGASPIQSGVRMLPTVITQILATMTASGLAVRLRYYNPWFFLAPIFMCTSNALYTQFTAFSTPASHWIGFQVIQGFGAGFGMQMASLAVQLELKDSPNQVPVGIALVMFLQYLGSTVTQVIAGTIFNNQLQQQLMSHAGLTPQQTAMLFQGGIRNIRSVTEANFPGQLHAVLEAYNSAITTGFFVPVAGGIAAFLLAFGIKWNRLEGTGPGHGGPLARLRAAKADKGQAMTEQQPIPLEERR